MRGRSVNLDPLLKVAREHLLFLQQRPREGHWPGICGASEEFKEMHRIDSERLAFSISDAPLVLSGGMASAACERFSFQRGPVKI